MKSSNMIRLLFLLVVVSTVEFVHCAVREQRHSQLKLKLTSIDVVNVSNELDMTDITNSDETENLVAAAHDFADGIEISIARLDRGVQNNTKDNEFGKALSGVSVGAKQFAKWVRSNLKGEPKTLLENFKLSIKNFGNLVPATSESLLHIKDSAYNSNLAVRAILNSLDHSLFLFRKIYHILKFKKYTNNQLTNNINEVLLESFNSLDRIGSEPYNVNELVVYAHQLKFLTNQLIERLNGWIKTAQKGQLHTTVEKTVAELSTISTGLRPRTKASIPALTALFKNSLQGIYTNVNNLDAHAHGQSNGIVREALFDVVGISMHYKNIFGILSGSVN